MKLLKTLSVLLLAFTILKANPSKININFADTLDANAVLVEASLFFEAYKIKQYEMWTINKGLNVVNNDPNFQNNKYKIYRKIDKVIFEVYKDSATTDEMKNQLADTALYLYEKGIKYDPEYKGTFMAKKAYVLNEWKKAPLEEAIAAYEEAFASGQEISNEVYYLAQLAGLYEDNIADDNDYQMQALDIYLKIADMEPDNALWQSKIKNLAEDDNQLQDFMKKSWYSDKENSEKAWTYAKYCKRNQDYKSAIEPLKFLIEKNPDVINYWKEIASAYQKIGKSDLAVKSYKELIDLQPKNRDSYFNLALLYKDMGQFSVARSYLQKAARVSPGWDYPLYIEAQLYEQSARNCGFEFEDKLVYLLAVETYKKVARMEGVHASQAADRVNALSGSIPTSEEYFFRKIKNGQEIKINGKCYDWINKTVSAKF
ncbi:MAG: hypothetical protein CR986_07230 [Ignavibacteriae bacterium]|nr:MAG: hypothetical protein CR986_07230 [Ignavibacteriota bacterium]